ncbi:MAG TPA: hypothetical protein VK866_13365 [Acidimicrobiales bacterium]|nr:hypothetical protein [Acidimicrobiales bacterium]
MGLDTAVGSLPHVDIDAAVAFALARQPRLPAAPSLPQRTPLEGMVAQAAWGVSGVTLGADGSITVVPDELDPTAPVGDPDLAGEPFATLRAFLDAVADRTEPVKLQLTGPVTLGVALHAAGADADRAFAVAGAAVRARAAALLGLAERRAPGVPLVVVVDEPGLTGISHPDFPVAPDHAVDLVSGALAALEPGALTGVHCCGPTDWNLVLSAGPALVSAPLYGGLLLAAGSLARYLDDGGRIAWGVVPTDGPVGASAGRLFRQMSTAWCDLVRAGCDPVALRTQSLVTPACGLATHGITQAERVYGLTHQVAARLHDQAVGIRLSVGA